VLLKFAHDSHTSKETDVYPSTAAGIFLLVQAAASRKKTAAAVEGKRGRLEGQPRRVSVAGRAAHVTRSSSAHSLKPDDGYAGGRAASRGANRQHCRDAFLASRASFYGTRVMFQQAAALAHRSQTYFRAALTDFAGNSASLTSGKVDATFGNCLTLLIKG